MEAVRSSSISPLTTWNAYTRTGVIGGGLAGVALLATALVLTLLRSGMSPLPFVTTGGTILLLDSAFVILLLKKSSQPFFSSGAPKVKFPPVNKIKNFTIATAIRENKNEILQAQAPIILANWDISSQKHATKQTWTKREVANSFGISESDLISMLDKFGIQLAKNKQFTRAEVVGIVEKVRAWQT